MWSPGFTFRSPGLPARYVIVMGAIQPGTFSPSTVNVPATASTFSILPRNVCCFLADRAGRDLGFCAAAANAGENAKKRKIPMRNIEANLDGLHDKILDSFKRTISRLPS